MNQKSNDPGTHNANQAGNRDHGNSNNREKSAGHGEKEKVSSSQDKNKKLRHHERNMTSKERGGIL